MFSSAPSKSTHSPFLLEFICSASPQSSPGNLDTCHQAPSAITISHCIGLEEIEFLRIRHEVTYAVSCSSTFGYLSPSSLPIFSGPTGRAMSTAFHIYLYRTSSAGHGTHFNLITSYTRLLNPGHPRIHPLPHPLSPFPPPTPPYTNLSPQYRNTRKHQISKPTPLLWGNPPPRRRLVATLPRTRFSTLALLSLLHQIQSIFLPLHHVLSPPPHTTPHRALPCAEYDPTVPSPTSKTATNPSTTHSATILAR